MNVKLNKEKIMQNLVIYNTLHRKKELFQPIAAPNVGMYVCGPTVYGDPHLGHARPAITFDVMFRYLTHIGYKVRYVRNITDVGHLEHDADEGEDKIERKARLEQLEPMEIAQAVASQGDEMVKYWMHNNMITINGQKMGKSLGNFITLEQFFTGEHDTLTQAYSPMTIRFFILSAHYRGTVDFSNEALQAAEKGYERLMNGIEDLARIQPAAASDENTKKFVAGFRQKCYDAMNDDLMTPAVISTLFEACHLVNILIDHKAQISADDLKELTEAMQLFAFDILGLQNERGANNDAREGAYGKVVDIVLDLRAKAKAEKNWAISDQIRDALIEAGFQVKDTKDGVTWKLNI